MTSPSGDSNGGAGAALKGGVQRGGSGALGAEGAAAPRHGLGFLTAPPCPFTGCHNGPNWAIRLQPSQADKSRAASRCRLNQAARPPARRQAGPSRAIFFLFFFFFPSYANIAF